MSSSIIILLLTLLQLATGFGLMCVCKIYYKPAMLIPLAVITGIAVFSIIPFVLQLLYIPLTRFTIFTALLITCLLLNIPVVKNLKLFTNSFKQHRFRIKLYEIPFLLIIGFIVFVSVWRCFYYPPYARDITSGAEVIAEYAVKEKTMINSVFTVNLETTNNQFKPPFIASLQVIYKLAGLPFGQVWLSALFVCLVIFLYHVLNTTLHRLISGALLICFLAIPEMYAYTFMILFDYSNAVFFFLALYFLIRFLQLGNKHHLYFSAVLMGFATYIRSETLVLAFCMLPLLSLRLIQLKTGFDKIIVQCFLFMLPAVILYVLCILIYNNHYLPVHYNIHNLVNSNLTNLQPFFKRVHDITTKLVFSSTGIDYYGYFIFLFLGLILADLPFKHSITSTGWYYVYVVFATFIGIAFLGYLLPLLDLDNSTKRALFKLFPLMLLYMGNSRLLIYFSRGISRFENRRK